MTERKAKTKATADHSTALGMTNPEEIKKFNP
jgi:hypothetical protein